MDFFVTIRKIFLLKHGKTRFIYKIYIKTDTKGARTAEKEVIRLYNKVKRPYNKRGSKSEIVPQKSKAG